MFKLGRRKKRFNERYNRIGSGQRIGEGPPDADQISDDASDQIDLQTGAEGQGGDAFPDLIDPSQSNPALVDGAGIADTERLAELVLGAAALSSFDLAGEGETPDGGDKAGSPAVSDRLRPHANGHDYSDGTEELPGWLDSFDPAKPPVKPPELPPETNGVPEIAGEAVAAESAYEPAEASPYNTTRKAGKPAKAESELELQSAPAEPAPAWLDIADEVESRPPPMAYDAEQDWPEPDPVETKRPTPETTAKDATDDVWRTGVPPATRESAGEAGPAVPVEKTDHGSAERDPANDDAPSTAGGEPAEEIDASAPPDALADVKDVAALVKPARNEQIAADELPEPIMKPIPVRMLPPPVSLPPPF